MPNKTGSLKMLFNIILIKVRSLRSFFFVYLKQLVFISRTASCIQLDYYKSSL